MQPALPAPPLTATPQVQDIVNNVKPQLQKKLGIDFLYCQAVNYRSQVITGANNLFLILVSIQY